MSINIFIGVYKKFTSTKRNEIPIKNTLAVKYLPPRLEKGEKGIKSKGVAKLCAGMLLILILTAHAAKHHDKDVIWSGPSISQMLI